MRNHAPIEILRERLHEMEKNQAVENMKVERGRRGIPPMLQELADRNEWRGEKILYNQHKM